LGDYQKYPTLASFVHSVLTDKYGTTDIDQAAKLYVEREVKPFLQKYNPAQYYPYPKMLDLAMQEREERAEGAAGVLDGTG
jgi:hypothetical protein